MIDEGVDDTYNCTVASSNRTRVQWVFREAPIPECSYNSHNPSWNNCQTESQPCVTSRVSVTEELFLVHSLILHLCNVTAEASGQYTCEVQGIDEKVAKRNNLLTRESINIYVNDKKESTTNIDDESDRIIIPLVSALASVLIVTMSIVVSVVMIKLFCYIKNPRTAHEAEDGNQEIELTSTLPTKKFVEEEDDWEFPREKLKLLQKIGKIINQTDCWGVCIYIYRRWQFWSSTKSKSRRDSTRITSCQRCSCKANLRQVITSQISIQVIDLCMYVYTDAIDSGNNLDSSSLWHELEIMKKIDTHPNICNLLACCTTKGTVIHVITVLS